MNINKEVVNQVQAYVEKYFSESMPEIYCFHNLEHTKQVVQACMLLSEKAGLDKEDQLKLEAAAWLHDTGYSSGPEGHEERSVELSNALLKTLNLEPAVIDEIAGIIRATKMPQNPKNFLEKVIGDADLSHLGNEHFWERNDLFRKELEYMGNTMNNEAWVLFELAFIKSHSYHTQEAKLLFEENKDNYYRELIKQLKKLGKKDKEDKPKLESLSRGVETLYKTAYQTHLNLNSLADSKAHIMLSVNSILLSASVSFLIPKWESDARLVIPTSALLICSLLTIFYAILTIKPKLIKGHISVDDVKKKTAYLLFFGNYTNMSLSDYKWGMSEMIKDPEYTYNSMSQSLYFLGQVLAKKYKFLNYCYLVFINGLILAVILFGICMLLVDK